MTRTKIASLFAVASIAVTGGSAFTASIGEGASGAANIYLGTLTSTITGGTLNDVDYTLDAAGDYITAITVSFTTNDFDDEHVYITPYTTGPVAGSRIDCSRKDSTASNNATATVNGNTIDFTGKAVFICGLGGSTTYGGNTGVSSGTGLNWAVSSLVQVDYRVAPGN